MNLMAYEWDKQCESIDINTLIALCELGEDYKAFCDDLELLIKSKSNKNLVNEAYQVMQGKFSIHSTKYKSFIEKHKRTIEIMNKYLCLSSMTILSYDEKGNRWKGLTEDYFYEYIQKNKENVEIIKEVALKLKQLGFDKIKYGADLDFNEFDYSLDTLNDSFAFLENIEINSAYLKNPIIYKTKGSRYCMCLKFNCYGLYEGLSEYGRRIYLNSLIFDPNSLPNELTPQSTVGVIKRLAANKKSEYSNIKDSVDLSIATKDLRSRFEHLKQLFERIDKIKHNEESIYLICQMELLMIQLQNFDEEFEKEVIDSNTCITQQKIEREKKLFLERREWSELHID